MSRLPSKEAREMDALLRRLGYSLVRTAGSGHPMYEHPDFDEPLVVSGTASDWRSKLNHLAILKRRHPEEFARRKADEPGKRKRKRKRKDTPSDRRRQARRSVERAEAPAPTFVGCPRCRYRWKSDIDPWGRRCPNLHCDGEIGRVAV